jgi:hypothetical protein
MRHSESGQAGATSLSPSRREGQTGSRETLRGILADWVWDNAEALEAGALGDLRDLEGQIVDWAGR